MSTTLMKVIDTNHSSPATASEVSEALNPATTSLQGALIPSDKIKVDTLLSVITQGDILYGTSGNLIAPLPKDTNATRYLSNTGTSNNPAWAQINLVNGVTGILPGANLGTGTGITTKYLRGDSTWQTIDTTPSGVAGGDLGGTYPNPTVVSLASVITGPTIYPTGSGINLTALNGSNIASGTVAAARVATLNQNTTGSAATLTTPRTINGVNFDGSAAITVTVPVATGITGLGTGVATALTINVGSAGAPVLFNGAGGTPSALIGTNITGTASGFTAGNVTTNANLTGAITSVGNVASLGSFTSANLLAALTNPTGTGVAVFGTTPTISGLIHTGGLTASGSTSNDFSGSTGTFKTSTGTVTLSSLNGIGATPVMPLDITAAFTATANNQAVENISSTITGRNTTSDTLSGLRITPTLTAGANTQSLVGLIVSPTYADNSKSGVIHYDAQFLGNGKVQLLDGGSINWQDDGIHFTNISSSGVSGGSLKVNGSAALTLQRGGTDWLILDGNYILMQGGAKFANKSASATPTGGAILESVAGVLSTVNTAGTGGALIDTSTAQTITAVKTFPAAGIVIGTCSLVQIAGGGVNNLTINDNGVLFVFDGFNNNLRAASNVSLGLASSPWNGLYLGVGSILSLKSGTNQRAGNATLVGGTVTVANTTVTANTVVIHNYKTSGGTIGTSTTYTVSAGVSFTITSSNVLDTSVISYLLIEVP